MDLNDELDAERRRLLSIADNLAALSEKLDESRQELGAYRTETEVKRNEAEQWKSRFEEVSTDCAEARQKLVGCQATLVRATHDLEALRRARAKEQAVDTERRGLLRETTEHLKQTQDELAKVRQQLSNCEDALKASDTELALTRQQLAEADDAIIQLDAERNELKQTRDELTAQLGHLTRERSVPGTPRGGTRCEVYEWVRVTPAVAPDEKARPYWEKRRVGEGSFRGYGVDFEEFETGPAPFTTAIVVMDDGEVRNVPVELVRVGPLTVVGTSRGR